MSFSGRSFPSQLEAAVFNFLELRQRAGQISELQHQDHIYLTKARIVSIPDFRFYDKETQKYKWAEAKGFETDLWKNKKRLWKHYGPGELDVYKGTASKIKLAETVTVQSPEPVDVCCPDCEKNFKIDITRWL